jgi:hypothetical protein
MGNPVSRVHQIHRVNNKSDGEKCNQFFEPKSWLFAVFGMDHKSVLKNVRFIEPDRLGQGSGISSNMVTKLRCLQFVTNSASDFIVTHTLPAWLRAVMTSS